MTCWAKDCQKQIHAHDLCKYHYKKMWVDFRKPKKNHECYAHSCTKIVAYTPFCANHYSQAISYFKRDKKPVCWFPECNKKSEGYLLCGGHRAKVSRILEWKLKSCRDANTCWICKQPSHFNHLCKKHYYRILYDFKNKEYYSRRSFVRRQLESERGKILKALPPEELLAEVGYV